MTQPTTHPPIRMQRLMGVCQICQQGFLVYAKIDRGMQNMSAGLLDHIARPLPKHHTSYPITQLVPLVGTSPTSRYRSAGYVSRGSCSTTPAQLLPLSNHTSMVSSPLRSLGASAAAAAAAARRGLFYFNSRAYQGGWVLRQSVLAKR